MFGWQVNEAADGTKVIKVKWEEKRKCGAELLVQLTESPIKATKWPTIHVTALRQGCVNALTADKPRGECTCAVKACSSVQSERKNLNSFSSNLLLSSPLAPNLNTIRLSKQKEKKDRRRRREEDKTGDDGTIDLLHVEQLRARAKKVWSSPVRAVHRQGSGHDRAF